MSKARAGSWLASVLIASLSQLACQSKSQLTDTTDVSLSTHRIPTLNNKTAMHHAPLSVPSSAPTAPAEDTDRKTCSICSRCLGYR